VSPYWNRRTAGLSPYVPGEQPRDRQFIKLNTNENPYPPSPKVIEAIRRAAGDSLRLYPDPACTELREAAAAKYGVKASQVFAGNGSDEALAFAFAAFFDSGPGAEPILFPDISYSFYPVYARLWDAPCREIPLREDFSIDYRDYCVPGGGVVIPNPNAPTGRALPVEELLAIAEYQEEAAGTRRPALLVDEAYNAFAGEGGSASAVPHIEDHPNILTVHTLSKSASLAGLRLGFAIGDEDLVRGLCAVRDSFNSYTVDRLAQAGGAAALADSAYYDAITRRVTATRRRTAGVLTALGFEVIPSSANFLFIRFPGRDGEGLLRALREKGILVRRFNKPRIADYLRVSIGADADMDAFLEACGEIIK
jgi:histidinol-phosphate aminotransferase